MRTESGHVRISPMTEGECLTPVPIHKGTVAVQDRHTASNLINLDLVACHDGGSGAIQQYRHRAIYRTRCSTSDIFVQTHVRAFSTQGAMALIPTFSIDV